MTVARDFGGYRRNDRVVNPGKLVRYPFLNAVSMVVNAGENSAACASATKFSGDGEPMAALENSTGSVCDASSSHNLVVGFRVP